jgi:hypothetical protein
MPDMYAKRDEFNALCKVYEDDLVAAGGEADPAEVARAVAEQLHLPYKYECDSHGWWETEVYFGGHPSARYMQGGTVGTYGAKRWQRDSSHQFLGYTHWTDGMLGSRIWR